MKLVLLISLYLLVPSYASEIEGVVQPSMQVSLFEKTSLRPGLATIVGGSLYFSRWNGRDSCPANDLYEVKLIGERKPEKILDVSCVMDLDSDGETLWVYTQNQVQQLKNGRLKKLEATDDSWHRKRVQFLLQGDLSKVVTPLKSFWFRNQQVFLDRVDDTTLVDVVGESGGMRYPKKIEIESTLDDSAKAYVDLSYSNLYLRTKPTSTRFSQWLILNFGSGEVSLVGQQEAMGLPSSVPFSRVAFRNPRFIQPTEEGLLIWEGSDHVADGRGLYYLSPKTEQAYHVWIPRDQHLSGVSYVKGGIVVSYPRKRRVLWFGSDLSQLEKYVLEADISMNEMLPAEGEEQ